MILRTGGLKVEPYNDAVVTIRFANCAKGTLDASGLPGASAFPRANLGRRAGTFCDGPTLAGRGGSLNFEGMTVGGVAELRDPPRAAVSPARDGIGSSA